MAIASASMAMAATSGLFSARCCADPKSLSTSPASSTNSVKISSSTSLGHLRTNGSESVSVDTGRHAILDPALQHANLMWFRGAYNAQIFVSEDENADSIVRRFRKAVMQAGVIPECRRRRYFETPQDIAKRKLLASHRRNKSRTAATSSADLGGGELQPPLHFSSRLQKSLTSTAMAHDGSQSFEVPGKDLLVVGPGVLGSLVAKMWLQGNEGSKVVGQTNTTTHHEELKSLGITPIVKDPQNDEKFPFVIFCAPPSGSSDYPAEVRAAAQRWNGEGSFLFTSSSALYDVDDNGNCDEKDAPSVLKGVSPRTDKLLNAEEEVLKVGGNVVRLAGLYTLNRGAHTFYLSKGSYETRPDQLLNLIHYEDAATLCGAILDGDSRGHIYMGCDNTPLSRQEMMDAVNRSGKYDQKFKEFTGSDGPHGKRMNNNATRLATGWKPMYESFPSFLGVMATTQSVS